MGHAILLDSAAQGLSDGLLSDDVAVYQINPKGKITREWWFKAPYIGIMHDMALTQKHIVIPLVAMTTSMERLKSGEPMAIAGLWETWHPNTDESTTSCCIITTDANVLMESIHDRMPVILDRELWATWLSLQEHRADELLPLIRPHDAVAMQARLVTHELNRVDCAMMRGWWSGSVSSGRRASGSSMPSRASRGRRGTWAATVRWLRRATPGR